MTNRLITQTILLLLILALISGCAPADSQPVADVSSSQQQPAVKPAEETSTPPPTVQPAVQPAVQPTAAAEKPARQAQSTGSKDGPADDPADDHEPTATPRRPAPGHWKDWPVLPTSVPDHLIEVYERGLRQGNNPHAFSVLGDCQSQPEVFMGLYDSDPAAARALPDHLRQTVRQFAGSFDRYSPTVKDGTTEGALLWIQWNDNKEKKCEYGETPLDCELRVHKPSIVFIHVGTHYEARNRKYLTTIIERLLEHGAVPVLVTKADNRELDERVNGTLASLAAEFDLPLWNFWASVQHLPDNGMLKGSDMYLSDEGVIIHREGALQTLDVIWRALQAGME